MKTLKEYIEILQQFVKENPGLEEAMVVYSKDDEGNAFHPVGDWGITPGNYDHKTGEWLSENEVNDDNELLNEEETPLLINAVCIN